MPDSFPAVFALMQQQLRAELVAAIDAVLSKHFGGIAGPAGVEVVLGSFPARRPPRPPGKLTRWVASKHARQVPEFVKEATGLKKKVDVIAKYGLDATWSVVEGKILVNDKPFKKSH
jgi:hypothetical protein